MKQIWFVSMAIVLASCGHNAAPVVASTPSGVEPQHPVVSDAVAPGVSCAFGAGREACLATRR